MLMACFKVAPQALINLCSLMPYSPDQAGIVTIKSWTDEHTLYQSLYPLHMY